MAVNEQPARRVEVHDPSAPVSRFEGAADIAAPVLAPLDASHARVAAQLHIAGQPGTFLTQLGEDALTLFYAALPQAGFGFAALNSPPSTAAAAAHLVGFISGTAGLGAVLRACLLGNRGQRGLRLAWLLAGRVLRRPQLLGNVASTLAYTLRGGPGQRDSATENEPAIELLSIMVEPTARSQGIGSLLMARFLAECAAQGVNSVHVTVDARNPGAQRFYMRHGFQLAHNFELYGRAMTLYRKVLV